MTFQFKRMDWKRPNKRAFYVWGHKYNFLWYFCSSHELKRNATPLDFFPEFLLILRLSQLWRHEYNSGGVFLCLQNQELLSLPSFFRMHGKVDDDVLASVIVVAVLGPFNFLVCGTRIQAFIDNTLLGLGVGRLEFDGMETKEFDTNVRHLCWPLRMCHNPSINTAVSSR